MIKQKLTRVLTAFGIILLAYFVYHCKNPKQESGYFSPEVLTTHLDGGNFVGSETCLECHADIFKAHQNTAHFNTSAPASKENVLGSFDEGSNVLDLDYVRFSMKLHKDTLLQHIEIKNRKLSPDPLSFDMVIGSGNRGQSYATWKNDSLFQLQASYHSFTDSWVNSPGYPSYFDKERPIRSACLKCHVTFAKSHLNGPKNRFYKEQLLYGIDCERCHRPAEKHVIYHRKNPNATSPKFMLALDTLPKQQRLDICAQCHSGPRDQLLKGNSFSFLSGYILDNYAKNSSVAELDIKSEVHGNQYGLLAQSKCFKQSADMDCISCHDPHKNQRGQASFFNQKCMNCHHNNSVICSADVSDLKAKSNDCIACHMPIAPSNKMKLQLNRTDSIETSFQIRSHLIGIYLEELNE